MNDEEYFLRYKQSFNTVFAKNYEDCAFMKDKDLRFQAVTDKEVKLLGLNCPDEVLGKTFAEIAQTFPFNDTKLVNTLAKQDKRVLEEKKFGTYLEVFTYKEKRKIYVNYKKPIINPYTKNCIGIRGQITSLVLPHVIKTLLTMHGAKGLLLRHKNDKENSFKEYPLNEIQRMVLFLAINNYSYSEIAVLLNEFGYKQITPIRVNDYLDQLKLIFHVRNKDQLIEKAIGLNFHTFLPDGLFNKFSSIEVSEEEAAIVSGNFNKKL